MKVISKHKTTWGFTALAFVVLAGCTEPVFKPHCYVVPQAAPVLDSGLDSGKMAGKPQLAGPAADARQIVVCLKPQMMPGTITHTSSNQDTKPGSTEKPLEGSASSPRGGALAVYDNEYSDTTNGAQAFDPKAGLLSVNARDLRARLDAVRNGEPE